MKSGHGINSAWEEQTVKEWMSAALEIGIFHVYRDFYAYQDISDCLSLPKERRPSLPGPAAADEPGTLDELRNHFTKVSSLPLLGLEYFHEYLGILKSTDSQIKSWLLLFSA